MRSVVTMYRRLGHVSVFISVSFILITVIILAHSNCVCRECSVPNFHSIPDCCRYECLSPRAALESIFPPRVLIFTSGDTRLGYATPNSLIQASTIINYQYASKNEYDYKYFFIKYKSNKNNSSTDSASCYNSVLNQERAGTWSRLQVVWYALSELVTKYDWFLYLDSDIIIVNQSMSLYNYVRNTPYIVSLNRGCHFILHANCDIAFMRKRSTALDFPSSSVFLFRSPDLSKDSFKTRVARLFQLWWHHNKSENNFVHNYEQSSLWNIVYQYDFYKNLELDDNNKNLYALSKRLKLKQYTGIMNDFSYDYQDGTQFTAYINSTRKTFVDSINRAVDRLIVNATVAQFLYQTVLSEHVITLDTSRDRIPVVNFIDSFS